MNFGNERESKNFTDQTNPANISGMQLVKNVIGNYLYKHQWVKGAGGKYFDPAQDAAWQQDHLKPMAPVDAQGRRADIDWGSNANLPGYSRTQQDIRTHISNNPGYQPNQATPLLSTITSPTATTPPAAPSAASPDGLLGRLWSQLKGN